MMSSSKSSTTFTQGNADDRLIAEHLQYLRISDVCRLLRISKPTLWRLRRSPGFPIPTQLSDRAIGWSRDDIQTWVAARRWLSRDSR
jgi:predicted DNA-binding transcriptional regulator AlpA